MPTNREVIDAGAPALPDPPAITDESLRYGNALGGVWGSEASPSEYGSYVVGRIPSTEGGIAVASNTVTLSTPGAVVAVSASLAASTGAKVISPAPAQAGEVRVAYDADGIPTLTFAGADAVTECAVHQMRIPAALVAHMNATAEPE